MVRSVGACSAVGVCGAGEGDWRIRGTEVSGGTLAGVGTENPSGVGGVKVSTFGAPKDSGGPAAPTSGGWWPFGGTASSSVDMKAAESVTAPPAACPKGVYLHGGRWWIGSYVRRESHDSRNIIL